MLSKFKDRDELVIRDNRGRYLLKALFVENIESLTEDYPGAYTLKEDDNYEKNVRSARKIYLEQEDVTEYKAAIALLGSWRHWKRLCECSWFQSHLKEWREELEVIVRSKAIRNLQNQSTTDKGAAAARWLAEKGWDRKSTQGNQ